MQTELSDAKAPAILRSWIAAPPGWLTITASGEPHSVQVSGAGEREAIALAIEVKADFLLADDKEARSAARRLNVPVIGTIGILELAAVSGWIELAPVFERLRQVDFFIDERLLQTVLDRHRQRPASSPEPKPSTGE